MRILKDLLQRTGLTVLDAAIVASTTLIVGALVLPFVFSKLDENQFVDVYDSLLNTKLAFESYYSQFEPGKTEIPKNGDFLPELVKQNILSGIPKFTNIEEDPQLHWDFKTGKVKFDVKANEKDSSALVNLAELLDSSADDGNLSTGEVQYIKLGKSSIMSVVLGLTPPIQLNTTTLPGVSAIQAPVMVGMTNPYITSSNNLSQFKSLPGSNLAPTQGDTTAQQQQPQQQAPVSQPVAVRPVITSFAQSFSQEINITAPDPSGVPLTPQNSGNPGNSSTPRLGAGHAPLPVAPSAGGYTQSQTYR